MKMPTIHIAIFTCILISHAATSADFATGDVMVCNPGPGMSYEKSQLGERLNTWRPDGTLYVHFKVAPKPANISQPKDGECAWEKRVFIDSDPKTIRMQARNTLKVLNAFFDNTTFKVKVLSGSDRAAAAANPFLLMEWHGRRVTIK